MKQPMQLPIGQLLSTPLRTSNHVSDRDDCLLCCSSAEPIDALRGM
jgi:hypothetical protein